MKRDEALAPLSRDHHQALYRALLLRRADNSSADEARREMIDFFDAHGAAHFRAEEELLLPAYVREGGADPADDAITRVLTDHLWIRARVASLRESDDPSVAELHELGERLDGHVRHEERVLFPAIESALPPDRLAALGGVLAEAERG